VAVRGISLHFVQCGVVSRQLNLPADTPNEVIEFFRAYCGEFFERSLASIFTKLKLSYPTGVKINLTIGEAGTVISAQMGRSSRTGIRICYDNNHNGWVKPFDLDIVDNQQQLQVRTEVVEC
jgi:hypothetical protein